MVLVHSRKHPDSSNLHHS